MHQHTHHMAEAVDAAEAHVANLRMSRDPTIRRTARALDVAVARAQRRLHRMQDADEAESRARTRQHAVQIQAILDRET